MKEDTIVPICFKLEGYMMYKKKIKHRARVMIVDNAYIVALSLADTLKKYHINTCALTSSGEQAIQYASKYTPDLVLMDICLEGDIDGIETAARIRDNMGIPSIFFSACLDGQPIERLDELRPLVLLNKSCSHNDLVNAIIDIMEINGKHMDMIRP